LKEERNWISGIGTQSHNRNVGWETLSYVLGVLAPFDCEWLEAFGEGCGGMFSFVKRTSWDKI
jgi:hypothetical protein